MLVLLNLLNELAKRDKCEDFRAFFLLFATSLMHSIMKEDELEINHISQTLKLL